MVVGEQLLNYHLSHDERTACYVVTAIVNKKVEEVQHPKNKKEIALDLQVTGNVADVALRLPHFLLNREILQISNALIVSRRVKDKQRCRLLERIT